MNTYADALEKQHVTIPDHLIADAEIPVEIEPQGQGDLFVWPLDEAAPAGLAKVPDEGVQVVFGEATGNSHYLQRGFDSPDVTFVRVNQGQRLVIVSVPEGQTAELVHTDEHGVNAMGPGLYAIHDKREQADQIRRVTD